MAYAPHLAKSLFLAKEGNAGCSVAHEVFGCGIHHITTNRCSRGTVIVTKRCYAMTSQIVGNDEKRRMAHQLLVTILRTAASNEQHDRWLPLRLGVVTHGIGQRTCQRHTISLVAESNLLGHVRIRRLGILGTLHLRHPSLHHKRH